VPPSRPRDRRSGRRGTRGALLCADLVHRRRRNMYVGVKSAGYPVSEETPVLLLVFAIPAAVALLAWWKLPH